MPAALWVIPTRVRPATVGRCVRFAGPGCPAGGPAILLFALMTTPIGGGDLRGRSPSGCLRSTPTKASEDDNHGHHQRDLHIVEVGKAKGRRREREGGDMTDATPTLPSLLPVFRSTSGIPIGRYHRGRDSDHPRILRGFSSASATPRSSPT